ncbi:MAG: peptidase M14 [Betaproteobacteria bacterium]|nr:MAG: peptidase M14 [Betaproteobacteria bacterium]
MATAMTQPESRMTSFDLNVRARAWPLAIALAGLVACSTTPPPASAPVVIAKPAAAPPVKAPERVASTPSEAPISTPTPTATPAQPPYGPAVAARFPDPPVNYRTPAFEPGHRGFTSNAELQSLLRNLVHDGRATPGGTTVMLLSLGSSQSGVPLEALLFTRNAEVDAASLVRAGRPTVLLIGQQHGDEPAGSEALMVIAQELARGALQPLLDRVNVLVLPRANPDGAQGNFRVTASGIDANRDHLLLKTPEAQAQAQLIRDYRPVVVIDAHEYTVVGRYLEKFGTVQRFDAMVQYAMTANLPEFITKASEEWFRQPMLASLKREGLTAEWYYTTSTDIADKKVSMGGTQPDTGRNVSGLTNAISFLIETRGVGIGRLHLKRRVHTHVTAMTSVLHSAADHASDLMKLRQYVDNEVSAQACQGEAVVEAGPTPSEYVLLMLDATSGADKPITVAWDSALALRTLKSRTRPCGYWLAADQTDAVLRLRGLGVLVQQVADVGVMRGETYREVAREAGVRQDVRGTIADAGGVVLVQVETVPTLIDAAAGSYYVPLDQPLANLAIAALEPDTQNSYVSNRILSGVTSEARVMMRPEIKLVAVP